jgi:hypothetical protein
MKLRLCLNYMVGRDGLSSALLAFDICCSSQLNLLLDRRLIYMVK